MFNVKKKAIIAIPVRMSSTRLPNKPLLLINNIPMIIHVINRALNAIKQTQTCILVAAAEQEIIDCVNNWFKPEVANGVVKCVLTNPNLPSGSDRINEALNIVDSKQKYGYVLNLQGDLPTIASKDIKNCLQDITFSKFDITTLVAKINNTEDYLNKNVVKAVLSSVQSTNNLHKAIYFSRASVPFNMDNTGLQSAYHHIGIYGYKRLALNKFTSCIPSNLEQIEKLEQLRALENNMKIGARIIDNVPIGVDTQEDLLKAEKFLKNNFL